MEEQRKLSKKEHRKRLIAPLLFFLVTPAALIGGLYLLQSYHNASELWKSALIGDIEAVDQWLEKGTNFNARRDDSESGIRNLPIISIAARKGNTRIIQRLLEVGADPNATSANGSTPLMWASWSGDAEAVRQLIDFGADVNKVTENGATAVFLGAMRGSAEVLDILIKAGGRFDVHMTSGGGWGPVLCAAFANDSSKLVVLLEAGADPNERANLDGRTPLMNAAASGIPDSIRILLKAGADVNAEDTSGNTALLDAARSGDVEVVELLVNAGADINQRNGLGETAESIAKMQGDFMSQQIVHYLEEVREEDR